MNEAIPKFSPGTELVSADLNALSDAARTALSLTVDPATGLRLINLPHGRILTQRRRLEMWVKITGGGTSGIYAGTQQIETASGTWANGPRAYTTGSGLLREANLSTTVPTGTGLIVRAWHDRYFWRFNYG